MIQEHPNYKGWYASLPPHTRGIVDHLLVNTVTHELIIAADDSSEEEWNAYTFLRALGAGTTDPTLANELTDTVLSLIPWDLMHFTPE